MIWLCVFPTLTVLNVAFGDWLASMSPVVRTFVLATIAVPIVIYGLMPHLHRARVPPAVQSQVDMGAGRHPADEPRHDEADVRWNGARVPRCPIGRSGTSTNFAM